MGGPCEAHVCWPPCCVGPQRWRGAPDPTSGKHQGLCGSGWRAELGVPAGWGTKTLMFILGHSSGGLGHRVRVPQQLGSPDTCPGTPKDGEAELAYPEEPLGVGVHALPMGAVLVWDVGKPQGPASCDLGGQPGQRGGPPGRESWLGAGQLCNHVSGTWPRWATGVVLALPLRCCVTLGKTLYLSEPCKV